MSECGQRASFNGADGISDIEGKVVRVAASEPQSPGCTQATRLRRAAEEERGSI
jgi:hypothetical protein